MKKYLLVFYIILLPFNVFAYIPHSARTSTNFGEIFLASLIVMLVCYIFSFVFGKVLDGLFRIFNPKLWKDSKKAIEAKKQDKKDS